MSNSPHIEINKSISTGFLSVKQDWISVLKRIFTSFLFLAMAIYGFVIQFKIQLEPGGIVDKFLLFIVSPILVLYGLHGAYRKVIELKLVSITTNYNFAENKRILLNFLHQYGYDILQESKDLIIACDENEFSFNRLWIKKISFIICEGKIYFNIVKQYPRRNPPVLIADLILKRDLKRYIKNSLAKS